MDDARFWYNPCGCECPFGGADSSPWLCCFERFHPSRRKEQMIEEVLKVNIWLGLVYNIAIVEWMLLDKKAKGAFL